MGRLKGLCPITSSDGLNKRCGYPPVNNAYRALRIHRFVKKMPHRSRALEMAADTPRRRFRCQRSHNDRGGWWFLPKRKIASTTLEVRAQCRRSAALADKCNRARLLVPQGRRGWIGMPARDLCGTAGAAVSVDGTRWILTADQIAAQQNARHPKGGDERN